jgi:hypothetical protein
MVLFPFDSFGEKAKYYFYFWKVKNLNENFLNGI